MAQFVELARRAPVNIVKTSTHISTLQ